MRNLLVAALLVSATGMAQAATFTDRFSSFYSFGDSLTDDGKFSQLDPPSLGGRFTNGLTWAEHIEDQFVAAGHDTGNLALGGAVAGDVNTESSAALATFGGQIATFANALGSGIGLPTQVLPSVTFKPDAPQPGTNPLLSVWFGANDIFQNFDPVGAANDVAQGIRALHAIDTGLFDDFLVLSLPDLGKTPAFSGSDSAGASAVTNLFNAQLALNIEDLRSEGLNIVGFETDTVMQKILDDIASGTFQYGIRDANTPCTLSVGAPLNPSITNPGSCLDLGVDPNMLLFVDGVHPNAVAHELLADDIGAALGAVPLPATLPLMAVVLTGIGLAARRRRY